MQIVLQSFSPSGLNAYFSDRMIGWALNSNFGYMITYIENYGVNFTQSYLVLTCDCTPLETKECIYHQRPNIDLKICHRYPVIKIELRMLCSICPPARDISLRHVTILLHELNQMAELQLYFQIKCHPADKLHGNKGTCSFSCRRIWYLFPQKLASNKTNHFDGICEIQDLFHKYCVWHRYIWYVCLNFK